MKRLLKVLKI